MDSYDLIAQTSSHDHKLCVLGGRKFTADYTLQRLIQDFQQKALPQIETPLDRDPPVNRMTDRCKNITLPQTSFAGGKNQRPKMRTQGKLNSSSVGTLNDVRGIEP